MKRASCYIIMLQLLTVLGCKEKISTEKEYYGWISKESNGLAVSKTIGDLKLNAKYFPAELLAFKELKGRKFTSKERDSLIALYSKSRTFLLTISPDEAKGAKDDILYRGISGIREFKQRVNTLNFEMEDMISLIADKKEYRPVLAVMENTYSTTSSRSFYIVFNDENKDETLFKANALDLEFRDEVFDTGINHFIFKKENMDRVPEINFWN